jgi:spherulation-specific family 4 protein
VKVLEVNSKGIFAVGYVVFLAGAVVVGFTALPRIAHAAGGPVGVAIPLYTYPTDSSWTAVIQAKHAYPNVPFIAVINPNSGPGSSQDSNYVQGIKNLQAAGIEVLGYVATGYAANSISSEESQVSKYHSWYSVNGIFFDEMSNSGTTASYYSTLDSYVHSLIPGSTTMGNPGTSVPTSLIGTLDILCIYEGTPYPAISYLTYAGYSPSYFSNIVYGVSLETSFITSLSGVNSWTYVTNAGGSNPYDVLPSYFTSEVATLSTLDGTASLTVNSANLSGNVITGMWATWSQNGAQLSSGYTPTTFTGTNGGTYTVTVGNYGSTVFCYWQDGTTNSAKTLTLNGNAALTAYYSTNGSCSTMTTTTTSKTTSTSSSTSTTSTSSTATTFLVTVKSATSSGTFSGMWTVVSQNGVTVDTGYTPLEFTATPGGSYTISIANYGNYVFSHWSTGSTSSTITITPTQAVTLTAYYTVVSCSPKHKNC